MTALNIDPRISDYYMLGYRQPTHRKFRCFVFQSFRTFIVFMCCFLQICM
jgi:hypothetical protein